MTTSWSLWMRKSARGCRGEGAPTLVVAASATFGILTAEWATPRIGRPLHALTGLWNPEDYVGHLFAILCACTAVYMCLTRLGNAELVQAFYTRWVILPLTLVIPLMQAAWGLSGASDAYIARFEDLEPDTWLSIYWTLFCGTLIYLLILAGRIAWRVRQQLRFTRIVDMYLATFGLTILFTLALGFHVLTDAYIHNLVYTLGYGSGIMWAATPAYSWWVKTRPVNVPDAMLVDADMGED